MKTYRVECHKVGGSYSSTEFSCEALARDFFGLHTDNKHELVAIKQWQPLYREPGDRVAGAWVAIEEFING